MCVSLSLCVCVSVYIAHTPSPASMTFSFPLTHETGFRIQGLGLNSKPQYIITGKYDTPILTHTPIPTQESRWRERRK